MTSAPMSAQTADRELRQAAVRAAALLREVRRPAAAVPGLTWSASETAAHMVAEIRDYAAFASGERDPGPPLGPGGKESAAGRNAAANAAQLARFTERELPRLADMITPATEDFLAAAARHGPDDRVLTSNGLFMTVQTMTALLLGELLIHGLDIARAAGLPWQISRAEALSVIPGAMAMVPDYLDRQRSSAVRVRYELRFRGGPRYQVTIDHGAAALAAPGPRPDCWISADPAAFLLVGYGRAGQWPQILRGRLLAGGRKPWLGLAFGQLITGP
jgi:uncharacterized protein (TIGR03083 family)